VTGIRVKVLGTGSGIPTLDHFGEAVGLLTGGSSYLFDLGEPVGPSIITDAVASYYVARRTRRTVARDRARSLYIYSVRAAFISHLHADHVSGLPMFLQIAHLWQKRDESFRFTQGNKLEIHMPRMGIEVTREYLELIGLGELRFDLEIRPLESGVVYEDGDLKVTALRNTHRLGSSFSFLAAGEGKIFAYSGDTTLKDLTELLKDPVDLLVVECAHFPPEELFALLKERNVKRVAITHLSPGLYGRTTEVEELGRRLVHDGVCVAHDGMEMDV
jgi:ribonuclease BN (tRNA processing enzyme)